MTGEIYRLDPNGHRVDLSRSPYQDTNPAVSPDGKHVAFLSDRSGRTALYEVGIDGRRLVRLGLSVPRLETAECPPQLAWQPQGQVLAVTVCGPSDGRLWIVRGSRKPLQLLQSKATVENLSWSADGRVLVAAPFRGVLRAFSPAGAALWKVSGSCCGSWSPQGLFALPLGNHRGFQVNDESGRVRFGTRGSLSSNLAWSPEGRLAVIRQNRLEVWTAGGSRVFDRSLPGRHDLVWANDERVVVGGYGSCQCKTRAVDLRTGKLSSASANWLGTLSPDRKLAIVTPPAGRGRPFALGVASPAGGSVRRYSRVAGCFGDGVWLPAATSLQFAGRGRSLVYQSGNYCDEPFANLYSVAPDGTGVKQLTRVQAQEWQPAVSPDASTIAYVWASATGLSCKGCSDGIRLVGANGSGGRTLTDPEDCTFDDSPTWSPDGSTILFSETGCDSPGELYTIPAAGGTPHDLGVAGRTPAWGPSRIAYVGSDRSDPGLWTMNEDGTDRALVAENGGLPAWSPDGRLAYATGNGNLTVVVGDAQVKLPFGDVTSLAW